MAVIKLRLVTTVDSASVSEHAYLKPSKTALHNPICSHGLPILPLTKMRA